MHDYVQLFGLQTGDLNGENGIVVKVATDGRLGVKLGEHRGGKLVSVKHGNLQLIRRRTETEVSSNG